MSVKINFGNEVRRVGAGHFDFGDWQHFCQQLSELFKADFQNCYLTYVDPEGDTITVTTAAELQEAERCVTGLLRLTVFTGRRCCKKERVQLEEPSQVHVEAAKDPKEVSDVPSDNAADQSGERPWGWACRKFGKCPRFDGQRWGGHCGGRGRWGPHGGQGSDGEGKPHCRGGFMKFFQAHPAFSWLRDGATIKLALPDQPEAQPSMPLKVYVKNRCVVLTDLAGQGITLQEEGEQAVVTRPELKFFVVPNPFGTCFVARHGLFLAVDAAGQLKSSRVPFPVQVQVCEEAPVNTETSTPPTDEKPDEWAEWAAQKIELEGMGFTGPELLPLLKCFNGDVQAVVQHLLEG